MRLPPLFVLTTAFSPSPLISQHHNAAIIARSAHHDSESSPVGNTSSQQQQSSLPPPEQTLGLLTFDLDDTLFPIGPVVREANEAMVRSILSFGYRGITNQDVLAATKAIRLELSKTDTSITYTNLRIQAVQRELERCLQKQLGGRGGDAVHVSVARRIFDTWLDERHASAGRNLYPDALEMLETMRAEHPDVTIGAVTNGRGNPLDMADTLRPYFDFCISGEDEGVFPLRKPHGGIYEATLARYREMQQSTTDDRPVEVDKCWVHVGDDLANDVGASAACGAKAVWIDMEEEDEVGQTSSASRPASSGSNPSWSTASAKEIEKRKKMALEAQESVSKRIQTLSELPGAVRQILMEASSKF